MGWNLSGELIETCSCDPHCPCWFGVQELMKMDQGWCDNALLFRVEGGESNGIDLAGRTVVVGADFPGPVPRQHRLPLPQGGHLPSFSPRPEAEQGLRQQLQLP